jgi:hypothetical protein
MPRQRIRRPFPLPAQSVRASWTRMGSHMYSDSINCSDRDIALPMPESAHLFEHLATGSKIFSHPSCMTARRSAEARGSPADFLADLRHCLPYLRLCHHALREIYLRV